MADKKTSGRISRKAAKRKRGRRYSDVDKAKTIQWVRDNPGREAIGKAAKKFKISDSTLRNWLKEGLTRVEVKKKRKKPKKRGRPKGSSKEAFKDKVEKLAREASATNIHLQKLLGKLGWPDL